MCGVAGDVASVGGAASDAVPSDGRLSVACAVSLPCETCSTDRALLDEAVSSPVGAPPDDDDS